MDKEPVNQSNVFTDENGNMIANLNMPDIGNQDESNSDLKTEEEMLVTCDGDKSTVQNEISPIAEKSNGKSVTAEKSYIYECKSDVKEEKRVSTTKPNGNGPKIVDQAEETEVHAVKDGKSFMCSEISDAACNKEVTNNDAVFHTKEEKHMDIYNNNVESELEIGNIKLTFTFSGATKIISDDDDEEVIFSIENFDESKLCMKQDQMEKGVYVEETLCASAFCQGDEAGFDTKEVGMPVFDDKTNEFSADFEELAVGIEKLKDCKVNEEEEDIIDLCSGIALSLDFRQFPAVINNDYDIEAFRNLEEEKQNEENGRKWAQKKATEMHIVDENRVLASYSSATGAMHKQPRVIEPKNILQSGKSKRRNHKKGRHSSHKMKLMYQNPESSHDRTLLPEEEAEKEKEKSVESITEWKVPTIVLKKDKYKKFQFLCDVEEEKAISATEEEVANESLYLRVEKPKNYYGRENVTSLMDIELRRSENAWKPKRAITCIMTEEEVITKEIYNRVQNILNMMNESTVVKSAIKILSLPINNHERLQGVANLIYQQAIRLEDAMCAQLCLFLLDLKVPSNSGGFIDFLQILKSICLDSLVMNSEANLNSDSRFMGIQSMKDSEQKRSLKSEYYYEKRRLYIKSLRRIRFVCALFKFHLLDVINIHYCITELLWNNEESLECLCELLTILGKYLVVLKSQDLSPYFKILEEMCESGEVLNRTRFMLQDVIDLRNRQWKPRLVYFSSTACEWIRRKTENDLYHRMVTCTALYKYYKRNGSKSEKNESKDEADTETESLNSSSPKTKQKTVKYVIPQKKQVATKAKKPHVSPTSIQDDESISKVKFVKLKQPRALSPPYKSSSENIVLNTSHQESESLAQQCGSCNVIELSNEECNDLVTEMQIKSNTWPLLYKYYAEMDVEEITILMLDKIGHTNVSIFAREGLIFAIMFGKTFYKYVNLLNHLIQQDLLTISEFIEGFLDIFNRTETYMGILSSSTLKGYLINILVSLLLIDTLSLKHLNQIATPENNIISDLIGPLLDDWGPITFSEKWKSLNMDWSNFLPRENIDAFLLQHKLMSTLFGKPCFKEQVPSSSSAFTMDEIKQNLVHFLNFTYDHSNNSFGQISAWILANVGDRIFMPDFTHAVMTAVCESAIMKSSSRVYINPEKFVKNFHFLQRCVGRVEKENVHCLYAAQAFVHHLGDPPGLLLNIFQLLRDETLLSTKSFTFWKTIALLNGDVAIHELAAFFHNLNSTDEEEQFEF